MLAYSSISQVGYIVLALGAATPLAFVGAVFHFFNHAIFKSLLFVNAASLEKRLGTTDMDKIGGMGSKMKVTSATSLIGLLSTAGIPPLSGFWSKLIIIIALFSAGRPVYAVIALLASALTLAYFLSLERKVFFGKVVASPAAETKASFGITFSEVLLAAITVAAGLGFAFILNTWLLPLKEIVH
jgi:multicomponent Na+:H+ antiporter subunit D